MEADDTGDNEMYGTTDGDFYDGEFLDKEVILEESTSPDIKPELKKLYQQHPECILDYVESVIPKLNLQVIPPDSENVDPNHRTYPFLTNYEKTKIIGLRANQISQGSKPFVQVPEYMSDVRDIARLELEQKRLPFIVKRPLPNGKFEYWRLTDLMLL